MIDIFSIIGGFFEKVVSFTDELFRNYGRIIIIIIGLIILIVWFKG